MTFILMKKGQKMKSVISTMTKIGIIGIKWKLRKMLSIFCLETLTIFFTLSYFTL